MEQWITWLILIIILTLIELFTINLGTIWFVISGILALIVSIFVDNYMIQFAVFLVAGVALLLTAKPRATKLLKKYKTKNTDRIIGKIGIVTEKISKNGKGIVEVDKKEWTAISDVTIKKGEKVKILEIEGTKIKVEKEKN